MESKTDGELMTLIAQGNSTAFHTLYQRYSKIVFGYSFKIVRQRATAEDISQDVWVKIVKLASAYRGEGSVKGWLLTIVRNQSISHLRSHKRMATVDAQGISENETVGFDPKETENTLLRGFELSKLKKSMDELPEEQRLALLFFVSENMSYEDIARELATTESAVKALIFRARKTLLEKRGSL